MRGLVQPSRGRAAPSARSTKRRSSGSGNRGREGCARSRSAVRQNCLPRPCGRRRHRRCDQGHHERDGDAAGGPDRCTGLVEQRQQPVPVPQPPEARRQVEEAIRSAGRRARESRGPALRGPQCLCHEAARRRPGGARLGRGASSDGRGRNQRALRATRPTRSSLEGGRSEESAGGAEGPQEVRRPRRDQPPGCDSGGGESP
mmetsp:Transcript_14435/g.54470  ORF Transcript_14435/g.54470 Transcript_14435/m.54470 type:complete len:202 (-) Transcript_14435:3345-3950(-)